MLCAGTDKIVWIFHFGISGFKERRGGTLVLECEPVIELLGEEQLTRIQSIHLSSLPLTKESRGEWQLHLS